MTDKELTDKLVKLGYTTLWLDYKVLTIDNLITQEQAFDNSTDKNQEHYRYQTFKQYLDSKSQLSEIEFDHYLSLTFQDNDPIMAGSAAAYLFNRPDLNDSQFERLCELMRHFGEWTGKVVTRQKLLRRLRVTNLTTDLFKECILYGDSVIHEYILNMADLDQLQQLAIVGKTKKVRNIANEKLNKLTRKTISR